MAKIKMTDKDDLPEDDMQEAEVDLNEDLSEFDINAVDDEPSEVAVLTAEVNEMRDRWMRALADTENIRKRGERDRRDAEVYGGSKLARDLLSVHDNLKRAVEAVDEAQRETAKAVIDGIELTMRDLLSTFAKHNILPIAPEVGEKFDPKMHQAMFEAPIPDVPGGHIFQCMSEGFTIGERLLRPAQVGVSSSPANKAKAPEPEADVTPEAADESELE